jgi:glycosyltransferase involved in cell wall biosynthesis
MLRGAAVFAVSMGRDEPHPPDVSIVVPLYNEEDNVRPLCAAVAEALGDWDRSWELLFVDDGSEDATLERLREVHAGDRRLRVLTLGSNFGQTEAMAAGIAAARAPIIVTMDGDLQSDPRDIPGMVARIDDGYDLVCGWRRDRKDDWLPRVLPSVVANWLIARLTGVPIHDNGCTLKAWRAELVRALRLYADMHRFMPALSSMAGARVAEQVVRHHPRLHGTSKYGLSRVLKVVADLFTVKMVTQFASRPGLWFFALSLPWHALALIALGAWALQLAGEGPPAIVMPSLAVMFLYLAGHFVSLSLFSEFYLVHTDRKQMREFVECLADEVGPAAPGGPGGAR